MLVYFYSLSAMMILAMINDWIYEINRFDSNLFRWGTAFLVTLPLTAVAGLRTINVGTDIKVYGYGTFSSAVNQTSLFNYLHLIDVRYGIEHLYAVLNYIVSRFSNNINVFLFIASICTILPFVWAALIYREKLNVPISLQLIVYWALFYGNSLNILRQSMAMSLVYAAVAALITEKKKSVLLYVVLTLIAYEIHRTALISFVFLGIYFYLKKVGNKATLGLQISALLIFIPIISTIVLALTKKMINTPFLAKYQQYITGSNWLVQSSYGLSRIVLLTAGGVISIFLLVFFILKTKDVVQKKYAIFFLCVLLIDLVTQFSAFYGKLLTRLGLYFVLFETITIPMLLKNIFKGSLRFIMYVILIIYMVLIFYTVTKSGSGEIYPYEWILN
jgi:hypothetical protein